MSAVNPKAVGRIMRTILIGVAPSMILLLCVGAWLSYPEFKEYLGRIPFDSAKWKNPELVADRIRIKMVDDLLRKHDLVGWSKEDIDDLLGVPPKTGYFSAYDYVYWLGPERGFISIDSEWLVIKFNQGKVAEVGVAHD